MMFAKPISPDLTMKKKFRFLPALLLLAFTVAGAPFLDRAQAQCTAPPSGLVGWWQGEGNANDFTGTNNATLSPSGASYTAGRVGQGFRFDGTNGYVQIPDSNSLKPVNITCEAWIWLDPAINTVTNSRNEEIIFKKNTWNAYFEGYSLLKESLDNGNGTYTDRFEFTVSRNGNQVILHSQTIAQRGIWYHVAGTYDGNTSRLFVNGVGEASAVAGFALDYDTTPVFIGTSGTFAPYLSMFAGIIDEPTIYSRALGTNELLAIYNAGVAGKCTSPAVAVSNGVPAIASFAPLSATNGALVTISGTNFSGIAASNLVRFGAVRANVLAATANTLLVAVPSGATLGSITVTVGGLTAASGKYFQPTFLGNGANISAASFAPSFSIGSVNGPLSPVIADVDGDGKPDLAWVHYYDNTLSVARNISTNGALLGAASFAPAVALALPTNGIVGSAYRLVAADLDGDGRPDLMVCEIGGNRVSIFHNVATPGVLTTNSFEKPFALISGNDCRMAAAVDVDGDGRVEVVALNYGDQNISLFRNIGTNGVLANSSFAAPVKLAAPGGPYDVVVDR